MPKANKGKGLAWASKGKSSLSLPTIDPCEPLVRKMGATKVLGKGFGMVVMMDGIGISRTMTVHRAIGMTTHGKDDWIISDSRDVPVLLSRKDHPKIEDFRQLVREYRTSDYLQKTEQKNRFATDGNKLTFGGKPRAEAIADAKKRAEKDWKSTNPLKGKAGQQKRDEMPPAHHLKFINDEALKNCEKHYQSHFRDFVVPGELWTEFLSTNPYETRSGTTGQNPQSAFSSLKGKKRETLIDSVMYQLFEPVQVNTVHVACERTHMEDIDVSLDEEHLSKIMEELQSLYQNLQGLVETNLSLISEEKKGQSKIRWSAMIDDLKAQVIHIGSLLPEEEEGDE